MPGLQLLMVGEGDEKEEGMRLANELGLDGKIHFSPFRQDVPDVLAAADIYALPSLWEGLPIGLLEAMAMGKAVIASEVDGTKEVIRQHENGWLISTDDLVENLAGALVNLAENTALRQQFQTQAIETINARFTASDMT